MTIFSWVRNFSIHLIENECLRGFNRRLHLRFLVYWSHVCSFQENPGVQQLHSNNIMHWSRKLRHRTSYMGYPARMAPAGVEGNLFFPWNAPPLSILSFLDSFYTSRSLYISLRFYASNYHFFSSSTGFSNPLSQCDCVFMALLLPTLFSILLFFSALCSYAILSKDSSIMLLKAAVAFPVPTSVAVCNRRLGVSQRLLYLLATYSVRLEHEYEEGP